MFAIHWRARFTWIGLREPRSFLILCMMSFMRSLFVLTKTDMKRYPWNKKLINCMFNRFLSAIEPQNVRFVFPSICSTTEDWRPPYGRNQCHDREGKWREVCRRTSSSDSHLEFCRLWIYFEYLPIPCLSFWFPLPCFCLMINRVRKQRLINTQVHAVSDLLGYRANYKLPCCCYIWKFNKNMQ